MEATYSSETSVDFQRTTQHYIPEDNTAVSSDPTLISWQNVILISDEVHTLDSYSEGPGFNSPLGGRLFCWRST
jgi:hypothetical protein